MPFNVEGGLNLEGFGQSPQGVVTIDSVSASPSIASVSYSYSDSDEDGFHYRLDGGPPVDILIANPFLISSLSPSTNYNVEVRAYNSFGAGSWSSVFQFQTQATNVIQSTVCFNGELNNLEFSGELSSLEFNGKIKTRC